MYRACFFLPESNSNPLSDLRPAFDHGLDRDFAVGNRFVNKLQGMPGSVSHFFATPSTLLEKAQASSMLNG